MRLYIVRHAIAIPHGYSGIKDDDRPLTENGVTKMRRAAEGLVRLGYIPGLLLTSPLVRARQTTDILRHAFGKKVEVAISSDLAPSGNRKDLYLELRKSDRTFDTVMIVGHQPSLGEIAGEIVFGSPEHRIDLKKGGVCALDVSLLKGIPKGSLVSILTPSILCKIGAIKS